MPPCKNDPKATYKGDEPSPKGLGYCAHAEKLGAKKKGKDGNTWVIQQTAKKVKRWVKLRVSGTSTKSKSKTKPMKRTPTPTTSTYGKVIDAVKGLFTSKTGDAKYDAILSTHKGWKTYFTHANGGRPYCVYISPKGNAVDIYKVSMDNYDEDEDGKVETYTDLVKSLKAKKVFVGKSPLNEMTQHSGGYGVSFDGNSILVKITPTQYVFIGHQIKSFKTKKEIIKYVSPVGNSDVPYPFGIDAEGRFYLMIEDAVTKVPKKMQEDPYFDYYYNIVQKIGQDLGVEAFYIKGEKYGMNTKPNPSASYDDLVKRIGSPLSIKFKGEKSKRVLSKGEYVKLLQGYNEKIGLTPMLDVKVIDRVDW